MAGLVDRIKNDVKKAGTNKGKFMYFRPDTKVRIRFLQDMDDGLELVFHDSFEKSVNVPCQEVFGRSCDYCEDDDLRTRTQYCWSVWDYEAKEVKLFMFAVNNFTPIPALMAMFENYGTITDRDYVVSVSGKGISKSYSVIPMDKVRFRNEKAKPYSEKSILKMLDKAFPCDGSDEDEDDYRPSKKRPASKSKAKAKSKPAEDEGWNEDEDSLPDTDELEEMKPQKLYNLCRERDIDAAPKKSVDYYVEKLEEWRLDHEESDEDDYDDDQDWGDEEEEEAPDYTEMSVKELYALCKERGIKVEPKKVAKYYIRQLEDYDEAQDDWGDEEDDEDDWEDED